MEFPAWLKEAIEEKAAAHSTAELTRQAAELSRRYMEESGKGGHLAADGLSVLTYAIMRMPATFSAVAAALEQTLPLLDISPATLLDVGAGTGAASFAASQLLDLESVTCLEREPAMLALGRSLMTATGDPLYSAHWQQTDLSADTPLPTADLVTAAYVLNELTGPQRTAALSRLWNAAGQLLLLVEPGTPEGFRQLKAAREALIPQGACLAAPCPHMERCPLPEDDWCHFTTRVARSRLHRQIKGGDVPYEDEKFCYLAFSRTPAAPAPARILRHPKIESGHITLSLCTQQDGLVTHSVRKRDGALFKTARKSNAGDAFPYK